MDSFDSTMGGDSARTRQRVLAHAKQPTTAARTLARKPAPGVQGLALLLAQAFLAAPAWQREELVRAGALVLGTRRRWLGPLVRAVLTGYPRQPVGVPRELARWIAAQPVFEEAVTRASARGPRSFRLDSSSGKKRTRVARHSRPIHRPEQRTRGRGTSHGSPGD